MSSCPRVRTLASLSFSFSVCVSVEPLHQWSILICAFRVTCCSFITSIKEKNKTAKKHHDKVANSCNVCVKDPVPTAYHSFHLKRKSVSAIRIGAAHTQTHTVSLRKQNLFYILSFPSPAIGQITR